jgi:hypothetical protein
MTDDDVVEACLRHGAWRVFYAAHLRVAGDPSALDAVGLAGGVDLGESDSIARVAFRLLSARSQAVDLAYAAVRLARMH